MDLFFSEWEYLKRIQSMSVLQPLEEEAAAGEGANFKFELW